MQSFGLIGPAGSGKDSVADILAADFGYKKEAFADPLRALAYAVNAEYAELVDAEGYEDAKRRHPYVRDYLVRLGNGVREHLGQHAWVDSLLDRLPDLTVQPVVVSDVRRQNEVDALVRLGFDFIRVRRPRPGADRIGEESALLDTPGSYNVINNGTPADLRMQVHTLVNLVAAA